MIDVTGNRCASNCDINEFNNNGSCNCIEGAILNKFFGNCLIPYDCSGEFAI